MWVYTSVVVRNVLRNRKNVGTQKERGYGTRTCVYGYITGADFRRHCFLGRIRAELRVYRPKVKSRSRFVYTRVPGAAYIGAATPTGARFYKENRKKNRSFYFPFPVRRFQIAIISHSDHRAKTELPRDSNRSDSATGGHNNSTISWDDYNRVAEPSSTSTRLRDTIEFADTLNQKSFIKRIALKNVEPSRIYWILENITIEYYI